MSCGVGGGEGQFSRIEPESSFAERMPLVSSSAARAPGLIVRLGSSLLRRDLVGSSGRKVCVRDCEGHLFDAAIVMGLQRVERYGLLSSLRVRRRVHVFLSLLQRYTDDERAV